MKKLLALILATLMLLSIVACDTPSSGDINGGDYENGDNEPENNGTEDTDKGDTSADTVDISRITFSTPFSEGKAFVRYGDMFSSIEYNTVYCIDKNGEILFKLDNVPASDCITGFYNGLSTIPSSDNSDDIWLCDTTGKIIKPDDVGATKFLINTDESDVSLAMFKDGYFFAEKTEVSFSGSTTRLAILDSGFNVIVDYSEEFFEAEQERYYSNYHNGFLYHIDSYESYMFNVREGKAIYDIDTFRSTFAPEYPSDTWDWGEEGYYDALAVEYTPTLDLSEYRETLYELNEFKDGTAPIFFLSNDTYFFTILKEDGSFCFDPVEIAQAAVYVDYSNGKYIIGYIENTGYEYVYHLETYDTTGKIAEKDISVSRVAISNTFEFSDDVLIAKISDVVYYFTYDFQSMFQK